MERKIICKHCGYEWPTESEMKFLTCPSCQKKTPVELHPVKSGDAQSSPAKEHKR